MKNNAAAFAEAVINPVGRSAAALAIPPLSSSILNATLAGHAFDLWVRCHLAAQRVIQIEPSSLFGFVPGDPDAERAADAIRQGVKHRTIRSTRMLRACLTFGLYEAQSRSGILIDDPANGASALSELTRLVEQAEMNWLDHPKIAVDNPRFAAMHATGRIIKADGDLLLDGNLIEIKTARRRNKQMEAWRQLAGYVVLNSMRREPLLIEQVTLWYVRFGKPRTFAVNGIFKPGGRDALRSFFEEYLSRERPHISPRFKS